MSEDQHGAATGRDQPRQVATDPTEYSLTIEDALLRYEHAGHARTVRSVQRYCAKGHLDCLRQETTYGDKFMITPESVARHIAQIEELTSATHRDRMRQASTGEQAVVPHQAKPPEGATGDDLSRQAATGRDVSQAVAAPVAPTAPVEDRYVKLLESENAFLREQVLRKDTQIGELTERAKETNILIQSLHNLVLRLSPGRSEPSSNLTRNDEPREERQAS